MKLCYPVAVLMLVCMSWAATAQEGEPAGGRSANEHNDPFVGHASDQSSGDQGTRQADHQADQTTGGVRVGLALAGGGALGFAHIGVILELEAAGIPVHYVSGTSMGSIVGALYATGYSGSRIFEIAKQVDWNNIFKDRRPRRNLSYEKRRADKTYLMKFGLYPGSEMLGSGVSAGQNAVELLDRLMCRYAASGSFDRFPRPLRIIATDLITGEEIVFKEGDLKSAIRASIAVPGAFTPLKYHDRLLIDGGWVNQLPVDAAREMGADYVIAVNLNALASEQEDLASLMAVLTQSSTILRRPRLEQNLARADLVITPDISSYSWVGFDQLDELVQEGRRAARAVLPQLLDLAARSADSPETTIDPSSDYSVDIPRISYSGARLPWQELELIKQELEHSSFAAIQEHIFQLYDQGSYEYVSYELLTGEEENELILQLEPRKEASAMIHAGYSFRSAPFSDVGPKFVLLSNLTFRDLSGKGSRWSTDLVLTDSTSVRTEYTLPLKAPFSAVGSLFVFSEPMQYYRNRKIESYYLRRRYGAAVGLRTRLFEAMEFTAAATFEWIDLALRGGTDLSYDAESGDVGLALRGVVDTYDRYPFPRRGVESILNYRYRYQVEQNSAYTTASFRQKYYIPLPGDLALGLGYRIATDLGSGSPEYIHSNLGGFGSFPGLYDQELSGRHLAVASSELRVPLFSLPIGFGDKVYGVLGGSIGNVWDMEIGEVIRQPDALVGGSSGLSADTTFGELHLRFALATGNDPTKDPMRYAIYIVLGNGEYTPFQSAFQ